MACRRPVSPPTARQALAPRIAADRPPKQAHRRPHSGASRCRRRVRHRDRRMLSLPARRPEQRAQRLQSTRRPGCARCGAAARPPALVRARLLTRPTATAASNLAKGPEPERAASMLPLCPRAARSRCGHCPSRPLARRSPTGRACVFFAALDQQGVDIYFAQVANDHRHAQAFEVAQDVIEQRGLAGSEKPGENGDGRACWFQGRFVAS